MAGKIDTGRTIRFELVVPCPRSEVYQMWTTPAGLGTFFAPRANVDLRVGGAYEIIFAPERDPEGENFGTKGARILRLEPGRRLDFEWIAFVYEKPPGGGGPPAVPRSVRDRRPLPTWVEVELEDVSGMAAWTRLRLAHRGFGTGGAWDEALPYFWGQWGAILGRLGKHCAGEHPHSE
jgi:uncharacterized protein YndB with AHSA1/START domain